jgi:hypothetical protein
MRKCRNGKVRRSLEEWEQILERFRLSGQSGAAFCRKNKLAKSSFEKWNKKLGRRLTPAVSTPAFVEWPAPAELESPISLSGSGLSGGEFELSLPGGVLLRWKP